MPPAPIVPPPLAAEAPQPPAAAPAPASTPAGQAGASAPLAGSPAAVPPPARLRVMPAGWQLPVPAGSTLLQAAQNAGVRLPRSCRNGTCRACLCRCTAGQVRHRIDWPGLSAEELAQGWLLPCVAEAASAEVTLEQPGALRFLPG